MIVVQEYLNSSRFDYGCNFNYRQLLFGLVLSTNLLNLYVAVELDRRGCEIKISGTISLQFVLVRMS